MNTDNLFSIVRNYSTLKDKSTKLTRNDGDELVGVGGRWLQGDVQHAHARPRAPGGNEFFSLIPCFPPTGVI